MSSLNGSSLFLLLSRLLLSWYLVLVVVVQLGEKLLKDLLFEIVLLRGEALLEGLVRLGDRLLESLLRLGELVEHLAELLLEGRIFGVSLLVFL